MIRQIDAYTYRQYRICEKKREIEKCERRWLVKNGWRVKSHWFTHIRRDTNDLFPHNGYQVNVRLMKINYLTPQAFSILIKNCCLISLTLLYDKTGTRDTCNRAALSEWATASTAQRILVTKIAIYFQLCRDSAKKIQISITIRTQSFRGWTVYLGFSTVSDRYVRCVVILL